MPNPPAATPRRRRWALWLSMGLGALVVAGAAAGLRSDALDAPVAPSRQALAAALQQARAQEADAAQDAVCVANGLAYDGEPVNVQVDNGPTLAWMGALVGASLYAPTDDEAAGEFRVYQPQPALADWAGARRLCIARGIKVVAVRNLGATQAMRFRGVAYPGVAADVVWTLDRPAPWLASPDVASAFAAELPSWRGARWSLRPEGWRLTQRRHFYLLGAQWLTRDALARTVGGAPGSDSLH